MRLGLGLNLSAGGAPSFSPLSISGLQGWYRGDETSVTGALVDSWTDKSGNARHLLGTGAARPTLVASALNSLPGLQFSGAQELLTSGTFSVSTVSVFTVFRATANGVVYEHATAFLGSHSTLLYTNQGPSLGIIRAGGSSYKNRAASWGADGANRIVRQEFGGTHATNKMFINGTAQSLTDGAATGDPGTAASTAVKLHVGASNGVTLPLTGHIMELLVYSTVLSAGDASRVEAYLGSRYGITVA